MAKSINAGKYNRKIRIYQITRGKDAAGFPADIETLVLTAYAEVKTTKGFTLVVNNTDYEKALTRFTIRYPALAFSKTDRESDSGAYSKYNIAIET